MTLLAVSIILYGLALSLALLVWALVTVEVIEWAVRFHKAGLERVKAGNRRDKCLEMLVELDKMAHND